MIDISTGWRRSTGVAPHDRAQHQSPEAGADETGRRHRRQGHRRGGRRQRHQAAPEQGEPPMGAEVEAVLLAAARGSAKNFSLIRFLSFSVILPSFDLAISHFPLAKNNDICARRLYPCILLSAVLCCFI